MELFSEVYGCYYEVVAAVLRAAPLDTQTDRGAGISSAATARAHSS